MKLRGLAVLAFTLISLRAFAQTPAETLASYRADYPTPMSLAQVGEMMNHVAWDFRADGMKLLGKKGGSNCPMPDGTPISCDYLVHAPSISGHDVIGDAGGASTVGNFVWGPGPEDLTDAIKSGARTLVDPIEPAMFLLLKRPTQAKDVSPKNQDAHVNTTKLVWTSNGDSFDVYFGTTNPPELQATHPTATSIEVGPLNSGTIYFWRIDARNAKGITAGPVWSFATEIVTLPSEPVTPPVIVPPAPPEAPVVQRLTLKTILLYIVAGVAALVFLGSGAAR